MNNKIYENTLKRIEEIFDTKFGTKEFSELEYLSYLVEKYEQENHPIEDPNPIEYTKYIIENKNTIQE